MSRSWTAAELAAASAAMKAAGYMSYEEFTAELQRQNVQGVPPSAPNLSCNSVETEKACNLMGEHKSSK